MMTNADLIACAADVLRPHRTDDDRVFGDVAAALLTADGNLFRGVCIDTGSGTGFCAEHAAIAAMVTAGEYRIARIVAVWRSERDGTLHVVPPCGRCREFIRQIDSGNTNTQVLVGVDQVKTIAELMPFSDWPE